MEQRRNMSDEASAIVSGATGLGIELGSTRIKACLVDDAGVVLATGAHDWENALVDGHWTYSLDAVERGVRSAYADLVAETERRHGVRPSTYGAVGVSAMMHGYLPFDAEGGLLVPFRTWRDTTTGEAAAGLTSVLGFNIPLRWSAAHLYQAVLDGEPHIGDVAHVTTLAGYVHWRLTGRRVLGVGDASGMFPIDSASGRYDTGMLAAFDGLLADRGLLAGRRHDVSAHTESRPPTLRSATTVDVLLPEVLTAGQDAGHLTPEGATWLDPTGNLTPGIPTCPPEGDAGTGMVATNSVAPRTGNVSAGTSVFAMVVLERPLTAVHHEIDMVTTPAGDAVAMVHCNNGASELNAWMSLFGELAAALGTPASADEVFGAVLGSALDAEPDAGGVVAYNYLAGEPITGLDAGRPAILRTPDSSLTLANLARAQLHGVFATLALGMRVLASEGVGLDAMFAHGGVFRTRGVAQRILAAALDAPVTVGDTAAEGGAWGMAVLAAYRRRVAEHEAMGRPGYRTTRNLVFDGSEASGSETAGAEASGSETAGDRAAPPTLAEYLTGHVFAGAAMTTCEPDPVDVAGFAAYLERYEAGLAVERAAVAAIPLRGDAPPGTVRRRPPGRARPGTRPGRPTQSAPHPMEDPA